MRELKYFIASSVDGFIAAEDGSFDDFVQDADYVSELFEEFPETCPGHLREAFGLGDENRHFDAVLMGRNTYEVGAKVGLTDPYPTLGTYVFSTTMNGSPDPKVEVVSDDAAEFVRSLKEKDGKDIWLCGGSALAASLLDAGLVDELIVKANPVLLGSGIPLFEGTSGPTRLNLTASRIFDSGVAMLSYRVVR